MAGPMPIQGDRDAWCRERLDFFCAVISDVDRESLKAELEVCETEEEAEGLMHSLLWQQDNMQVQELGATAVDNPTAPEVDNEAYSEEVPPFFMVEEDPPAWHPHRQDEARQGLPATAPDHYVMFHDPQDPRDHEPQYPMCHELQHPRDHEPRYPMFHGLQHLREHDHPCHEYQPLNDQQQEQQQQEEDDDTENYQDFPRQAEAECHNPHPMQQQQQQQEEDDTDNYQDFPRQAETEHHKLQEPHLDHNPHPMREQQQQEEEDDTANYQDFPPQAEEQEQQQHHHEDEDDNVNFKDIPPPEAECLILQDAPHVDRSLHPMEEQQNHQEQVHLQEEKEVEIVYEHLPQRPPRMDTSEPALVLDPELHEPPRLQELPDDNPTDNPSDSDDQDQFVDLSEEQESGSEAEMLPIDGLFEDVPSAAGGEEAEGSSDDMEPIEPTSEKSDPYFDADEPSAEDFVDVEEEPPEDDPMMHPAPEGHEEVVGTDSDVDGAAGGRLEDEEMENIENTNDDERLAKELSDEMNAEEQARMESDERLARELAEEMELEERRREAEDEELARMLAEENEEHNQPQRQDNNPPVEIIFAEEDGNPPPPEVLQVEDMEGDEEMARRLEVQMREEREEDEKAGRVAALINMFPDADPTYLTERMDGVESEEAFRQVVEVLLQCQRTEPRMSGYQKQLKQNHAARHDHDTQEPAQATALPPTIAATTTAATGQVFECTICFEEEVPMKDMGSCNALYSYHEFCIECIRKHVAALIGQGQSSFRCMNGYCEAEFAWRTLRRVMEPVVYRKVQERRQQEEVMAAGVENLVSCPFCCFMIIMPDPENKVLECLNPECLKESCRMCKEPSHIPLRCEEVERDNQKDARTMLENRMAEAMIRQCPKCGKRFVTEGGCNKMTCSCGTVMCYLCKKVITDGYNHFEQRGGVTSAKCPLWSNANEVHTGEVRQAAAEGREELDGVTLVHDPTREVL